MRGTPDGPLLYVIPGSHSCRTAMLMLEYKGIAYRRADLITGLHPFSVRLRGFPGNRATFRSVDGQTPRQLAMMSHLGTVPALRFAAQRIQTNHEIARFLDRIQPEPPLFPSDRERRQAVEEVQRWGDDVLQMATRRIALVTASHGLDAMHRRGNDGRLGPLLAPNEPARVFASRTARIIFRAGPSNERALLSALPPLLDRIDAWIDAGVLDGQALNVADFMIAPCLALLTYRPELRPEIARRPAGALLDRLLPEPPP